VKDPPTYPTQVKTMAGTANSDTSCGAWFHKAKPQAQESSKKGFSHRQGGAAGGSADQSPRWESKECVTVSEKIV